MKKLYEKYYIGWPKSKIEFTAKILTVLMLVCCHRLNAQNIDTIYSFSPKIVMDFESFKQIDSTCQGGYCIQFKKDSDLNSIYVTVYENSKKTMEGKYILTGINYKRGLIVHLQTGETENKIREATVLFARDGYWSTYKAGKVKKVYYDKGRIHKIPHINF